MKKTYIYLGILLALLIGTAYLVFNKQKPSEEEQRAFQTPDIAEIFGIELKDRNGNITVLTKLENKWLVDDKHPVNKLMLNDFFYALEHMEAVYPVPGVAKENVLTQMVANSTKVSLYHEGDKEAFKVFVVGGPNHDQDGTYMLMEIDGQAAENPYVVNLPGFRGYITPRFSAIRNFWVGTQFTKLLAEEIQSISINYFQEDTDQSFSLMRGDEGYELAQGEDVFLEESLNVEFVEEYFNAFMNLSFERYIDNLPNQDSVVNNMHYLDLKLGLSNGSERKVSVYFKPFPRQENLPLDTEGNPLRIDPDKLFAYDHASQSYFTIQYYTFGKLFVQAGQLKK